MPLGLMAGEAVAQAVGDGEMLPVLESIGVAVEVPLEAPVCIGVVDTLKVNVPIAQAVGVGVGLEMLVGERRAVEVKNDVGVGVNGLDTDPVERKHSVKDVVAQAEKEGAAEAVLLGMEEAVRVPVDEEDKDGRVVAKPEGVGLAPKEAVAQPDGEEVEAKEPVRVKENDGVPELVLSSQRSAAALQKYPVAHRGFACRGVQAAPYSTALGHHAPAGATPQETGTCTRAAAREVKVKAA